MNDARWYPTVTTLANGDAVVVSGDITDDPPTQNIIPQVWETANGDWRTLTTAQAGMVLYPWLFLAPNGKVFLSRHGQSPHQYLDTSGTGAWTVAAETPNPKRRDYGSGVMYVPGKVLIMGGGGSDPTGPPPFESAEVIDLNTETPTWREVGSLSGPRRQLNATLLPDGTVLVTGGSSAAGFNDENAPVLHAEFWDPASEQWTTLASNTIYRGYHSVAFLLPDGGVVTAGGTRSTFANFEVFLPPYLFRGPRPTIASARNAVRYNQAFFVGTPDAADIARVTWVRLSSVTHAFNFNQRFNELAFSAEEGGVNVTTPAGPTLAPPGHYLLFLLNSRGVPSVARFIRIEAASGAPPAAPPNLSATAFSGQEIGLSWTDNSGDEEGFLVERSADGINFIQIADLSANSTEFSDAGLEPGTTRFYRVRAYNLAGDSSYSPVAEATTLAIPAAPSGLTATAVSPSQIDLAWTDNASDEDGYDIERSLDGLNFSEISSVSANVTAYADSSLERGTTYYYRVRAFNAVGNSGDSNIASATTLAPAVTLTAANLSFGEQRVGTPSSAQTVTVENSGTATLTLGEVSASGDYTAETHPACPSSVAAGDSCDVHVTFTPSQAGLREGTLTIQNDAPDSPHLAALSGTGTAPAVSLSPTSLNFGEVRAGTLSAPRQAVLTNTGDAVLNIAGFAVDGDFSEGHACGLSLAAGAGCAIEVTFAPTASGARQGTLTVTTDAGGSPHTVSLSGTGTAPVLALSVASLDFGNARVGTTGDPLPLTLSNVGTATLTITGISVTGDEFQRSPDCVVLLEPGASCTLQVTFTPAGPGTRAENLTLMSDAPGSPHQVALVGAGTLSAISLSAVSLDFDNQRVGTSSAPQPVQANSVGDGSLLIQGVQASAEFVVQSNSCEGTFEPNTACLVEVSFSPAATGARGGTLTITSDAPASPHSVQLTGTGTAPAISLFPAPLEFGKQPVGNGSDPQQVTLTNSGTAELSIAGIATLGDFSRSHMCPETLAEGGTCAISVTFTPTSAGVREGTLSVSSDAPTNPAVVLLSGTGTDFAIDLASGSQGSASVSAGQTATYILQIVSSGFSGTVTFACTGAPQAATCGISPSSVTLGDSTAFDVTVTVRTTARTISPPSLQPGTPLGPVLENLSRLLLTILVPLLIAMVLVSRQVGRDGESPLDPRPHISCQDGLAAVFLLGALFAASCGGGGGFTSPNPGTPPGTYTLTVTATSQGITRSETLSLTVQ